MLCLTGECAHCQLVTMLSWKMYAVFDGRMCTLSVGYHVFLIYKFENCNPSLYSVYISMLDFSFRRVSILKKHSQK